MNYTKKNKIIVKAVFEEKASAMKSGTRKEFKKMVEFVKKNKINFIIFAFLDRMSRNAVDGELITKLVEEDGLVVVFVQENITLQRPIKSNIFLQYDILLDTNTYELLKKSLKQSLRDDTEHHKSELSRINKEIEKLQKRLVKIYYDKMDEVIDNDIWLALKNEWETELNKLRTEQQIHDRANVNYVEFGLKILDVCKKASLPSKELTEQDIVEILYSCAHSITVLDKSVKLKFKEPFDTIEKLILFTKEAVKEHGFEDFKDCIFDEKTLFQTQTFTITKLIKNILKN